MTRRALITGGARGLGLAIARVLHADGSIPVLCDVDRDALSAASREIDGEVETFHCDICDRAAVDAMFERCEQTSGAIDILVNNAGVSVVKPFLNLSASDWQRVIDVNLTAAFHCAQRAARSMAERNASGRIINITSISGQRGGTGRAAYGAAKGGLETLTKVMAVELAPHGITVNAVAPGPVMTELAAATHTLQTTKAYKRLIPMQRYAHASEIADAVAWLASEKASYVTGHTINVDGGFGAAGLMADAERSAS